MTDQTQSEQITHGRHCACGACARQDWSEPQLAPCGMHGSSCPPRYDPWGTAGDPVPVRRHSEPLSELDTTTTLREQAKAVLDRHIAVEKFYADRGVTLREHTLTPDEIQLIRAALDAYVTFREVSRP